jgi:heat shock protein HtpX
MSNKTVSYVIETEVPSNYLGNLLDFVYRKYVLSQEKRFANVARVIMDGDPSLTFTVLDSTGKQNLDVEIRGGKPIKVKIIPLDEMVPEERINEVKQDVIIAVELFEEEVRNSTLYFAWREGEEIVPEKLHGKEKKSINRLFLETQIFLFVVFISLGMFLFLIVGWLAPIVLMVIQFVFVFYSNKIIARSGDWRITESNPTIHLVEYHLPLKEHDEFRQTYSGDKLMAMKKEIYEETLAKKGEIDCETTQKVFAKHGFECRPENLSTKKVNVHQLVKTTADKFDFPMPEVVVSNTMIPNAAASGPSPSHGVVLITTGLLVQLEDDEILSVLGHEFGHLKGRDPLILYGLTAGEFLFRFYVVFPLFPFIFFSLLFFLYFWAVMTVIYFIAKFFEARADLVSAMVMGQPQVLAEALEKIGFRRLLYERVPSNRVQEWISLEPHPPIYFRVDRLEKLKVPVQIKHPLVQSVKDVTNGFLVNLRV